MNIKRKLKTLAAAFLAVAGTFAPFGAWATTYKATIGNLVWSYTVDDSLATITKVDRTTDGDRVEGVVTVPDMFGTVPVTVIGYQAFRNQEFVTEVVLPNGIVTIGEHCFEGCKRLTTLELPSTVRTVCKFAFSECSTLANLKLNEGLTEIGNYAFGGCAALKALTLPSTVQTLGYGLFSELPITEMEIPDSVTEIGNDLFLDCGKLESVAVGKRVPGLSYRMFAGCEVLTSVTLKEGYLDYVGEHCFEGCKRLTTLELPSTVRTVHKFAFSECSTLANLKLNEGLTEIGNYAFGGCAALKALTLPSTVQTLGYGLFSELPITEMEIPDSVTEIGNDLFLDCGKLESVVVGKRVPGLSYRMFAGCEALTSVTLKEGLLDYVGEYCFNGCKRLTTLELPSTVRTVYPHAFMNCQSLRSVTLNSGLTEVGGYAFDDCAALHYVYFQGDMPTLGSSIFNGVRDRMVVYISSTSSGFEDTLDGHPVKRISVKPENADAPYDFYLVTPTSYYESWPAPVMVTSARFEEDEDVPELETTFRQGSPIYLSYAYDEYWRGEAFNVTNRITLSGAKSGTVDYVHKWEAHETVDYGWKTNATPDILQNLEPGEYTLTLQLNAGNRLAETDYSNNSTSITFTVVGVPRYTVMFNLNGASGTAPASRTLYEGNAVGELPKVTAPAGWTFLGWYTATSGGDEVEADTLVTANMTCFAQWSKCDIGFYTPTDFDWTAPLFVTTDYDGTTHMPSITQGERVYLKYAFRNLAGEFQMEGFKNRFTLNTGATFDDDWSGYCLNGEDFGWHDYAWDVSALQNLAPGTYTLTCKLDATGKLSETDEGNNTKTITFTVGPAGTTTHTVTFNANGGTVSTATRQVASGSAVGTLPTPTWSGHTFVGWFTSANGGTQISTSTKVTANVTYYAHWTTNSGPEPTPIEVTIIIGNTTIKVTVVVGEVWGSKLPKAPAVAGKRFVGWFTGANGTGTRVTASTVVSASTSVLHEYYVDEEDYYLYDSIVGMVFGTAATTYDGYLCDANGNVKGTIQVKVGKVNAKTGLSAVKATVIGLDGKKTTLKAAEKGKVKIAAAGPTMVSLTGGEACEVTLGTKALSGTYGSYYIDGALNVFTSKDAADKAVATAALGKWQGAVNVAWEGAQGWNGLSVSIAAKGKAKVSGTLANGKKVSAKGQLIVGEEWCCIPVLETKKAHLAFNVWLPRGSSATSTSLPGVVGIADAVVGKPGALKGGSKFRLGAAMGDAKYAAYLPDGVAVGGGAKWTLPKAGKVQLAKDGTVDASKLGENPAALKLTYKAKDGSFKGSFKAYADVSGKPKGTTVKVAGVLVNGVGYGTATVKGGSVPVKVE